MRLQDGPDVGPRSLDMDGPSGHAGDLRAAHVKPSGAVSERGATFTQSKPTSVRAHLRMDRRSVALTAVGFRTGFEGTLSDGLARV